uniref:Cytosol aminopeptidase domain-containing protein n=1 Tax=Lactuca sativa TaxID=4236 RepID=A0A9R1XT90_LACSA|nr:hypothetical protein LSAT_V11C200061440 [Lactuca sativa]
MDKCLNVNPLSKKVNNTDVEGGLTLADALVYACNQGVDKSLLIFCLNNKTYIFTPGDELSKEVVVASEVAGEKLWRLPMEKSYWESMKPGVADMVNTGGRQDNVTDGWNRKSISTICMNLGNLEISMDMDCEQA